MPNVKQGDIRNNVPNRDIVLTVRVRPHEAHVLRLAAVSQVATFSEFARDALLDRAGEILAILDPVEQYVSSRRRTK